MICGKAYQGFRDDKKVEEHCCGLFISNFFQFAFYLSLSVPVISTSLAQHYCKCCNLLVSAELNV